MPTQWMFSTTKPEKHRLTSLLSKTIPYAIPSFKNRVGDAQNSSIILCKKTHSHIYSAVFLMYILSGSSYLISDA